jgi:flagellin-like hook-associated protein FlgL
MEKIVKQMKSELNGNPQAYARLAEVARNYLKSFADLVNQRDATRALFGGSNVAGPAVQLYEPGTADPGVPFAGVPGGISYRYKILATGLATDTAMKVSDTLTVTYTVSANSPATNAFTKAMDALIRIADFTTAVNPTPIQANVDAAIADLDLARTGDTVAGYDGFDGLRGRIVSARGALDLAKNSHENFLRYADDVIGKAENADLTEVAVRLRADELQLQASYASLARITSITLLDFLI